MDSSGIGIEGHSSPESINFANHMTFAEAADCGVAAHLANGVEVLCEDGYLGSHSGCGKGGFHACVAGSDYENVVCFWVNEHG